MPDECKNFSSFLDLDFRKWWRYVKMIYIVIDETNTVPALQTRAWVIIV